MNSAPFWRGIAIAVVTGLAFSAIGNVVQGWTLKQARLEVQLAEEAAHDRMMRNLLRQSKIFHHGVDGGLLTSEECMELMRLEFDPSMVSDEDDLDIVEEEQQRLDKRLIRQGIDIHKPTQVVNSLKDLRPVVGWRLDGEGLQRKKSGHP